MSKKKKLNLKVRKSYKGIVVDICDNIVSVSGLKYAFSGEFIRFKSVKSDIFGFVWNLEDNICKITFICSQTSLKLCDLW